MGWLRISRAPWHSKGLIAWLSLSIVRLALHLSTARERFGVTEIFLAYDSGDRDRARPLRDALAAQGFDVHWEQEPPAGVEWETWVRRRLAQCRCVVVLRSAAVHSNRMRHVVALAEEHGTLIVVRLEPRSVGQAQWQALGHGQAQSQAGAADEGLDLASWSGDLSHPGWQELCRRIEAKLRASLWVQRLIHDLEAERARWRSQYETSAARCRALNDELARERSETGAAQDKVAGLEAQLDADARLRVGLQTRIMELEQRLTGADSMHAEDRRQLGEALRQMGAQLAEARAALAGAQDEAARLKAELASLESDRRELRSRITSHVSTISERHAHIVDLEAKVARQDAEAAGLQATVTERGAEIGTLKVTISERDAGIAALRADLAALQASNAERDGYTAELEASVAQRDTYIARLTANLAERRAYMADLEASIAQRDTHIADLKTGIAERDTEIASLRSTFKELEHRVQGHPAAGVPLPALGRMTLPAVLAVAGTALSLLKLRRS
jgi:chromosome segregation ATPase